MTTTEPTLVDRFTRIFRGRTDIYGSADGYCTHEQLTKAVYEQHLTSTNPTDWIGVYCMVDTSCTWGCVDIDGKDFQHDWDAMLTLAKNLRRVLHVKDVPAHIEQTRNGYHVWVFPRQPLIPAYVMRRALMAACVAIGYDPKEVNPKAEGPRPGTKGYGNFVRLPYGGALTRPREDRIFIDGELRLTLAGAVDTIEHGLADTDKLEAIARLWTPPPPPRHHVNIDAGLDVEPILRRISGLPYTVWRDGPDGNHDRSNQLVRLTHLLHQEGLPAEDALAVVVSADKRWGKFQDRPEQLERIVEGVYG